MTVISTFLGGVRMVLAGIQCEFTHINAFLLLKRFRVEKHLV